MGTVSFLVLCKQAIQRDEICTVQDLLKLLNTKNQLPHNLKLKVKQLSQIINETPNKDVHSTSISLCQKCTYVNVHEYHKQIIFSSSIVFTKTTVKSLERKLLYLMLILLTTEMMQILWMEDSIHLLFLFYDPSTFPLHGAQLAFCLASRVYAIDSMASTCRIKWYVVGLCHIQNIFMTIGIFVFVTLLSVEKMFLIRENLPTHILASDVFVIRAIMYHGITSSVSAFT